MWGHISPIQIAQYQERFRKSSLVSSRRRRWGDLHNHTMFFSGYISSIPIAHFQEKTQEKGKESPYWMYSMVGVESNVEIEMRKGVLSHFIPGTRFLIGFRCIILIWYFWRVVGLITPFLFYFLTPFEMMNLFCLDTLISRFSFDHVTTWFLAFAK